jgi:PASTA domain-containing protein
MTASVGSAASSTVGSSAPSTGTSTSTGPSPTGPTTLTGNQTVLAVAIVAAALLAAGAVVIFARSKQRPSHGGTFGSSYIRAWVTIALVLGLLIFCALSFGIDDTTLRSTLMGGLTASVGAAIAFYFSSNSATQASQDLLTATGALDTVPHLLGMTHDAAVAVLGKASFKFEIDPSGNTQPGPATTIDSTTPTPGAKAAKGSTVSAHFP